MNLCYTRISVLIVLSSLIFVVATFICHMPTQPIYLVSHGPSFFIIYLFILHSFVTPHHHLTGAILKIGLRMGVSPLNVEPRDVF